VILLVDLMLVFPRLFFSSSRCWAFLRPRLDDHGGDRPPPAGLSVARLGPRRFLALKEREFVLVPIDRRDSFRTSGATVLAERIGRWLGDDAR